MKRKHKSIVIIGAGPGGLAAAMLLACSGLRVTVLERQAQVGGRTTTLAAKGFRFDLGPTLFLYPQVLEAIFASVGKSLWNELELIRLDPQYSLIFGAGGQLHATPDFSRMEQAISALCPADAASFRRFMEDNRFKLQQFTPCLERAFLGWRDLSQGEMLKLLPLLRPWLSLDQDGSLLCRSPSSPRVLVSIQVLGHVALPLPKSLFDLVFPGIRARGLSPAGWVWVRDDCMARIAANGVNPSRGRGLGNPLRQPEGSRSSHCRRNLSSRRRGRECRLCQGNEAPGAGPIAWRWNDRRISQKQFSCSTFMLYLGIEGRYDHLGHHTIYLDENYVRNLREIEDLHVLSETPSFYVQNACVTDPSLSHERQEYPLCLGAGYTSASQRRVVAPSRCVPFARFGEFGQDGIKDVERRICFEHLITPADWDRRYEIHRGATSSICPTA